MKVLIIPNNINEFNKYNDTKIDGYIIGLKGYSIFNNCLLTIEEMDNIIPSIKNAKKEVFILINKLMYNQDIPSLCESLKIIDKLDVDGIIFDDLSILNLKDELGLKTNLVYGGNHLLTNHYTANYYLNKGVNFGLLATEITLENIIKIKENTKMKLMMNIYGYLGMTNSSRKLIANYFEYINKQKEHNLYYIHEHVRKEDFPIYEDENGTYILNSKIMNGSMVIPELIKADIDYIIVNGLNINTDLLFEVTNKIIEIKDNYHEKGLVNTKAKEISDLTGQTDYGFLYKETVYKVKNNE